jgi:hypothetical protein
MSVPKSAPRRYTSSRQLIAGDDFNNLSDHNSSFQTLTPAGAAQASGVQIDAANVEVAAAAAAGGLILPVSYPGAEVSIINNSLNTTTIYPQGATDVIQNGATGYAAAAAGVTMATLTAATFFCIKTGFWQVTKAGGP